MRRVGIHGSVRVRALAGALLALVLSTQPVVALEGMTASVTGPRELPDDCRFTHSLTGMQIGQAYRVDVIGFDATSGQYIAVQPNYPSVGLASFTDDAYRSRSIWGKGGSLAIVSWRFDLYRTSGAAAPVLVQSSTIKQGCTYKVAKTKR